MRDPTLRNIYWDKSNSQWRVQVGVKNTNVFVGRYRTVEEAKAARDKWYADNGGPRPLGWRAWGLNES